MLGYFVAIGPMELLIIGLVCVAVVAVPVIVVIIVLANSNSRRDRPPGGEGE